MKRQVLVAQAIRDAMTTFGYSVPEVWKNLSYTKNINKKPSEEVKRAEYHLCLMKVGLRYSIE